MKKVIFKTEYSRKFPDPLNKTEARFNIDHHVMLVRAVDLPSGISKEPNPREQRIDWGIYKDIRASLENADEPSFHLKNKGITILAQNVEQSEDKRVATVFFDEKDGIVDGGHTYEIILKSQSDNVCPDNQYVRIEILTGIPQDMFVDITGGLNTAVQVQQSSLANLQGRFDWIETTLSKTSYADKIAYRENESDKEFDIRDIISIMTLFNAELFPTADKHPKIAYTSKAQCLTDYLENEESYKKLKPILKDILVLHDYIHLKADDLYNEDRRLNGSKGRAGGMKGVFETRQRGKFKFIFMDEEKDSRLYDGTLYPMLGAMRFLIKPNPSDKYYAWKLESFEKVKELFNKVAPQFVAATQNTSVTYGRRPNAIGKDDNLWTTLYQTVALRYYMEYAPEAMGQK